MKTKYECVITFNLEAWDMAEAQQLVRVLANRVETGTPHKVNIETYDAVPAPLMKVNPVATASAAPDLLEAAKLALKVAENWIHDQLDGTSLIDSALLDLESVRTAIAKAEGGAV